MKYRIFAGVLAILALLGTWFLYQGDFRPLRTEEQQIQAIRKYASADVTGVTLQAVLHPVILHDRTFEDRRIITFTDSEINDLLGESNVTEPSFLHIYETPSNIFQNLTLYDADGRELPGKDYLASNQSVPSPGIGSADTNAVYWFCGIVLLVGGIIVKFARDAGKPKREETA